MREIVLRDFFLGRITPSALAKDVEGSKKKVGPINWVVEIEDMESQFQVTPQMLVSICDAVLSGQLPNENLSVIGFALVASDHFEWDAEDVIGDIIHDWSCPEINYPLTLDNIRRFRNWLLGSETYPSKPPSKPSNTSEHLISRTEKKWLRKAT
jgi:hypothetical protein